jgi:hypothetical protein
MPIQELTALRSIYKRACCFILRFSSCTLRSKLLLSPGHLVTSWPLGCLRYNTASQRLQHYSNTRITGLPIISAFIVRAFKTSFAELVMHLRRGVRFRVLEQSSLKHYEPAILNHPATVNAKLTELWSTSKSSVCWKCQLLGPGRGGEFRSGYSPATRWNGPSSNQHLVTDNVFCFDTGE